MPSRLRKCLRLALLALLGLVLLSVLVLGFLLWDPVSRHRIAARAKAARAAGDPVTLTELAAWVPEPPPGKNAARLLEQAAALTDANEDLELELDLPIQGASDLPPHDEPFPADMLARIRQYLANQRERLSILHQAATVPHCKLEFDTTGAPRMARISNETDEPGTVRYEGPVASRQVAFVCDMRDAVRLLTLEAVERGASGRPDEATQSLCAALRVANALRAHPEPIQAFVGIACDGIALMGLADVLARGQPSAAASRPLEQALRRDAHTRTLEGMLLRQRSLGFEVYPLGHQKFLEDGFVALGPSVDESGDAPDDLPGIPTLAHWALIHLTGMLPAGRLCYIDMMSDWIALARRPYPESVMGADGLLEAWDRRVPERYPLCRMTLPVLRASFFEVQCMNAALDSARTALATLRYKAKHRRLPETLDALVPGFLDAVPPDPFDGKPLRYRREPTGFVVYALGENDKDDSGRLEWDDAAGERPDIGFRVRRPANGSGAAARPAPKGWVP